MSEIWGVFDKRGFLRATEASFDDASICLNGLDIIWHSRKPHTVARLYTAADVRAILHDMPEAAARFEGTK